MTASNNILTAVDDPLVTVDDGENEGGQSNSSSAENLITLPSLTHKNQLRKS